MSRKKYSPEAIVTKLRQVDVMTSEGKSIATAVKATGVTETEQQVVHGRCRRAKIELGQCTPLSDRALRPTWPAGSYPFRQRLRVYRSCRPRLARQDRRQDPLYRARVIAAWNARKTYSRNTIKVHAERLRTFFRFAEDRGWCTPGMATAIRPPRVYTDEPVPAGLRREDVLRLLATTEGDRPVNKRDRAILMLFVAYGLRASEVTGLQLDDLDWENETLRVRRPKTGRTHLSEPPRVYRRAFGSNIRLLFHVRSRFHRTSPLLRAA